MRAVLRTVSLLIVSMASTLVTASAQPSENPPDFVPEPATWTMALLGIACVAGFEAYRRRKSRGE